MSRQSRGHFAPKQSRPQSEAIAGGVGLDQVQQNRQIQEAQLRMRVESIATALYAQFVNPEAANFEEHCAACARLSVDSALVFAREVWGVQGQRVQSVAAPEGASPPQPIIED
jgi:hypothetical protein